MCVRARTCAHARLALEVCRLSLVRCVASSRPREGWDAPSSLAQVGSSGRVAQILARLPAIGSEIPMVSQGVETPSRLLLS